MEEPIVEKNAVVEEPIAEEPIVAEPIVEKVTVNFKVSFKFKVPSRLQVENIMKKVILIVILIEKDGFYVAGLGQQLHNLSFGPSTTPSITTTSPIPSTTPSTAPSATFTPSGPTPSSLTSRVAFFIGPPP